MTKQTAFEKWWDSPTYAVNNDYREDSPIYWADIGWQAALKDQAEYIALLELNNKFKDDRIAQLQLDNDKLREALKKINITACLSSAEPSIEELESILEAIDICSDEALSTTQPESVVLNNQTTQKPDRTNMMYYKNDACKADDANSFNCICWSKETVQKPNHTCRYSRAMQSYPRKCLDCNEAETHGIPESVVKDSLTVQKPLNDEEMEIVMKSVKKKFKVVMALNLARAVEKAHGIE